jgi:hypothetical protein
MKVALVLVLLGLTACPEAQTAADVAVTLAGDVCKLVSQDDPTAPQWVQVACQVEGLAGPVIVALPYASWTSAQGQAAAQAAALKKAAKK